MINTPLGAYVNIYEDEIVGIDGPAYILAISIDGRQTSVALSQDNLDTLTEEFLEVSLR